MAGPLAGLRIIEMAGIGPAPFAAMMLADHGAEVIRIDRLGGGARITGPAEQDILLRSRAGEIRVDLKNPEGVELVRDLARGADGLVEGFRPGVMERLGLGPDVLLADNPRLVFGRMTGWGQTGPLANAAGHDINYIALSGALAAFGRKDAPPTPPVNLVGDFGGGAMMLAFGMVSALLHVQRGGEGQVIDCAMTDGSALLMAMLWSFRAQGMWSAPRGGNFLDTGAHFYESYQTADGKWIAIGAIEPQFYALLRENAGLADDPAFDAQMDPAAWPALKGKIQQVFAQRTRDEWCALLEGTDACFSPVLDFDEAPVHPHNAARGTFVEAGGITQPAPAPRYSNSQLETPRMAAPGGKHDDVLKAAGILAERIAELRRAAIIE